MTNHKKLAQQEVYKRKPELMVLSEGCRYDFHDNTGVILKHIKNSVTSACDEFILSHDQKKYSRTMLEQLRYFGIIGHPILLNHWLAVLDNVKGAHYMLNGVGQFCEYMGEYDDDKVGFRVKHTSPSITFNLTTGQPATEADFQAICTLLGVSESV